MKITHISAGRDRSVALTSDGTAHIWGSVKLLGATLPPGYPGEMCTSNPTEIGHNRYAQPLPQALNPGQPFASVADGYLDTWGVLRSGAVLSCRPVVSKTSGAAQSAMTGLPAGPVQLVLTESAGFARYAGGAVWSWGMQANGQLGRPATGLQVSPAPVAGLSSISALAAGHGHVLALSRSGQVWAWGANAAGQLGTGGLQSSHLPTPIKLPARITRIAAGDTHSFAVDDKGQLWGWGANNFGQVGPVANALVQASFYSQPQRIQTNFAVAQVDAGMFYSVATTRQGDVFAWGWNGMGQLGQGAQSLGFSNQPLRLKNISNITLLSAGVGHVLAANDAGVLAWGDNRASACGAFPSTLVQALPLRVAGLLTSSLA